MKITDETGGTKSKKTYIAFRLAPDLDLNLGKARLRQITREMSASVLRNLRSQIKKKKDNGGTIPVEWLPIAVFDRRRFGKKALCDERLENEHLGLACIVIPASWLKTKEQQRVLSVLATSPFEIMARLGRREMGYDCAREFLKEKYNKLCNAHDDAARTEELYRNGSEFFILRRERNGPKGEDCDFGVRFIFFKHGRKILPPNAPILNSEESLYPTSEYEPIIKFSDYDKACDICKQLQGMADAEQEKVQYEIAPDHWLKDAERKYYRVRMDLLDKSEPSDSKLLTILTARRTAMKLTEPSNSQAAADMQTKSQRGFNVSALADKLEIDTDTLNFYAKIAGVPTPGRGKKNFRYPQQDCMAICDRILSSAAASKTKAKAMTLRARLSAARP